MIDHLSRVLFRTREGLIFVGASVIYLVIGLLAKFVPSIEHVFGFIGFMALFMPAFMLIFLFKAGMHRRNFQSSWFTTILLLIFAFIPVIVTAKTAIPRLLLANSATEPLRIPRTIGFANLSGDDLSPMVSEDVAALSPLFAQSTVTPPDGIPVAEILFVYAHLNEDGTIGPKRSDIRNIALLTNASIVVVASPNSGTSIKNAAALSGPKTANIVFTLDRNDKGFSRFFRELFEKMRNGKNMLVAWVELAPQNPEASLPYAPQTILLSERGKVAFPR